MVSRNTITYDVLMKGDYLTWVFSYIQKPYFLLKLYAGSVQVVLLYNEELLSNDTLTYSKNSTNSLVLKGKYNRREMN